MRVFVTRSAWKETVKSKIEKKSLVEASLKASDGLADAKLGAHLYKQHVGRKGDFRAVLYVVKDQRAVVLHIFPKNEQANITSRELKALRDFVAVLNRLGDPDYAKAARERGWTEISDEKR